MVTSAPTFDTPEEILDFIPDNDIDYYSHLDENDILDSGVCKCSGKSKWGENDDNSFYTGDKQGIYKCSGCGGLYGVLIPNH